MGLATSLVAHQRLVLPAHAQCQPTQVFDALSSLERVDQLLSSPTTWNDAVKLLDEPLIATRLAPALEACTEQPGVKDNLMYARFGCPLTGFA